MPETMHEADGVSLWTLCEESWERLVSIGFLSVLELTKAEGEAGLDRDGAVAVGGHCHSADDRFAAETGPLLSLFSRHL